VTKTRFETDLARHTIVGLDTAVLIYHLDDTKPYSTLTESAFTAIAAGRPVAVVSTISLAELLVKPYADNRLDRAAAIEAFLGSVPNVRLVAPPAGAAREAARLRARYGLRMPDALVVATAKSEGAGAVVTNDRDLRRVKGEGLSVLVLSDYT